MAKTKKDMAYYTRLAYKVISYPRKDSDGEKYWIAEYPEVMGATADGVTRVKAINNAKETFKEIIEVMLESGHQIPEPKKPDVIVEPINILLIPIPQKKAPKTVPISKSEDTAGIFKKKRPVTLPVHAQA